jgi:multiple sugar transport system ATP-binding protein
MIAGLEEITSGTLRIGDRVVNDVPPKDRDIAMVFQSYALYPHMTVRDNLAFGLKLRKVPKPEIERRVKEAAETIQLQKLLERKPKELSGGQRQRVALGRAIVREPAVFLMDEPLSNLDAKLRVDMRAELARLHDRLGITTVYVTHDQVEAMTLGSRVAVMRDGTIQQVDAPQVLYREPVNLFVAAFIGSPSMNLAEAEVLDGAVEFAGFRVPVAEDGLPPGVASGSGPVILGIRPQDFEAAADAGPGRPTIEVEVAVVEELGSATHVLFTVEAPPVDVDDVRAATDEGERATLLATDSRALFTAEVSEATVVRPGQRLRLALDPGRFHFFDPQSGERISGKELATAV